ncbi:MAG: sugar ABC transporter ATP-binding protein [Coriobacteriales bacterium]|jgi:putative multiple sugar transport system ATP-binding protein|nr:sugar ABC transporter ATP-binding protein [Coriobacteriales bacterium]
MTQQQPTILRMQGITKSFQGVRALDDVTLEVGAGTIHAICGENGAGKSTLMNVLSGVHPYGTYEGKIVFEGQAVTFKDIKESVAAGIAIIHQELTTIPELSITENIFIGNEITKFGLINWDLAKKRTTDLLSQVGLTMDPGTPIKYLGAGQQQLVEIAKALSKDVRLLILDEPTSSLNETESNNLLGIIKELKGRGITAIMISHKLNEIAMIADAVTVIRDGRVIETYPVTAGQVDENRIIRSMVGRTIENRYPLHESHPGEVIFEVADWCVEDPNVAGRMVCKHSNFYVRAGEIVGFAGLMGAGRTELMRSIFGHSYGIWRSGSVKLKGTQQKITSVDAAIRQGLAYLPEDRKVYGINLLDKISTTIVSANLKAILQHGLISLDAQQRVAEDYHEALNIKMANVNYGVTTLSGGNQQKVVLAKWLFTNPDTLILDEPTRGIDVGAKYEIYKLIHALADEGKAIILVSSELVELLGMADRIYTLFEGRITGMLKCDEANQEKLMRMMTSKTEAEPGSTTRETLHEIP